MDWKFGKNGDVLAYLGNETNVTFPHETSKGVEVYGVRKQKKADRVFDGLEEVVLPEGYSYIEEYVFQGCKNLRSISFPTSLCGIGKYALEGCESLTEISILGKCYCGYNAFKDTTNLKDVYILNPDTECGDCIYWQTDKLGRARGFGNKKCTVHIHKDSVLKDYFWPNQAVFFTDQELEQYAKQLFGKGVYAELLSDQKNFCIGEKVERVKDADERKRLTDKQIFDSKYICLAEKSKCFGKLVNTAAEGTHEASMANFREEFSLILGLEDFLNITVCGETERVSPSSKYFLTPVIIEYKN